MTQNQQLNANSTNALDNLFVHGTMFDLTIRVWQARKNAQAFFEELGISADAWNDHMLVGTQVKFIDEEIYNSFREHELKARHWLNRNSLPFINMRFVPYAAMNTLLNGQIKSEDDVKDGLKTLKTKFDAAVTEFLSNFDDIRTKYIDAMAAKKESYRTVLEKVYPTKEEVAGKFFFGWQMFDIRVPQASEGELSIDQLDARSKIVSETMAQLQKESNLFVAESVSGLRTNVIDALGQFNKVLNSSKTVKSSSINAVKNVIQNFRELNFANDKSFDDLLKSFESNLGTIHNIPKDQETVKVSLSNCVQEIVSKAKVLHGVDNLTGQITRTIDVK